MNRNFLGTGWHFPVAPNESGSIETATAEADVRESIRIILGTSKGERVMRPEFGCGIHDFAFATVNTTTLTMIRTSVEDALVEWEPRIEVRNVDVSTDRLDAGRLLITVEYLIRRSNVEGNLVYPFYLGE